MRELRPLLAVAVAAAVVSACGGAGGSAAGGTRHVSLSFVYATTSINAMVEMAMGARAAARDTPGVSFTAVAPPGAGMDGSAEVTLFQAALKSKADGIALQTSSVDLFIEPLRQARSSGIPLVAVDTPPPPGGGVPTYVGNSNFEVGQLLATKVLERIPASATGELVIGNAIPGLPVLDQRVIGMLQVIRLQRPALQVVGPFNSHIVPAENLDAWRAEVSQHPNAVAYVAPSDLDAVSLAQIQRETGRRLLVGACDLEQAALQGIRDGLVYTLVSPEHWLKGYIAVRVLAQHAQSGKALPQGWWNPGALLVSQSNVDEVLARQQDEASRSLWFRPRLEKQFSDQSHYVKPMSAAL
jgi:ABC-type sugar transport system substrate-binding protein